MLTINGLFIFIPSMFRGQDANQLAINGSNRHQGASLLRSSGIFPTHARHKRRETCEQASDNERECNTEQEPTQGDSTISQQPPPNYDCNKQY
jgi:hypothetical protein